MANIGLKGERGQRPFDRPSFAAGLAALFLASASNFVWAKPMISDQCMVVSPQSDATDIGVGILESGGNAFDAAAAMGFALAVTYPMAGNIGGGGFLVGMTKNGKLFAIDHRDVAPAAASRDMFLDENGTLISGGSTRTHRAIGVPGTVAGLLLMAEKYGELSRERILAPAIGLARNGFVVSYEESKRLAKYPDVIRLFVDPAGEALDSPPKYGDVVRQPKLGRTLTTIAAEGRKGFYEGAIADEIVADMRRNGGLLTHNDLKGYKVVERDPFVYRNGLYELVSHPLPASGGLTMAIILALLDQSALKDGGYGSARSIALMTEAQRLAFVDRNYWFGDPDFVDVPIERLLSEEYLDARRALLPSDGKAGSTEQLHAVTAESNDTTHYTVVDKYRNAVAVTTTLNSTYGLGKVAGEAGFLWNNNMDNFSAKPGVPNQYGLTGQEANAIAPGKRPLSSMTPTIVRKEGAFFMSLGSPGGPTIINSVLQVFLNTTVWNMDIQQAIDEPRVHSQALPDRIEYEPFAISPNTMKELETMGYQLYERDYPIGRVFGIQVTEEGYLAGHADRRTEGTAKGCRTNLLGE